MTIKELIEQLRLLSEYEQSKDVQIKVPMWDNYSQIMKQFMIDISDIEYDEDEDKFFIQGE